MIQGKTILNIGGGSGREAEYLLKNGAQFVLLMDIAPGQLKCAQLRTKNQNIKELSLILSNAELVPVKDNQFDIGFIFMALHHFPSHDAAINELWRTSKK